MNKTQKIDQIASEGEYKEWCDQMMEVVKEKDEEIKRLRLKRKRCDETFVSKHMDTMPPWKKREMLKKYQKEMDREIKDIKKTLPVLKVHDHYIVPANTPMQLYPRVDIPGMFTQDIIIRITKVGNKWFYFTVVHSEDIPGVCTFLTDSSHSGRGELTDYWNRRRSLIHIMEKLIIR